MPAREKSSDGLVADGPVKDPISVSRRQRVLSPEGKRCIAVHLWTLICFTTFFFWSSPGRRDSLESHRSLLRWCPLCPVEGIVKVERTITIVIGSTPSAAGVAVKEILVGAGETKSPTRLNAVATDSLRDWICCHYLFKESGNTFLEAHLNICTTNIKQFKIQI